MKIYNTIVEEIATENKEAAKGFKVSLSCDVIKLPKNKTYRWIKAENFNLEDFNVKDFDFGIAIKYLKDGFRVQRKSWTEGDSWVIYIDADAEVQLFGYGEFSTPQSLAIKKPFSSDLIIGWTPSTDDLFANDWMIYKAVKKDENENT